MEKTSKIIQICFHLARDVNDGRYQRISKLQNDFNKLTESKYYEFQIVGIVPFIKNPNKFLATPAVISHGKKRVLPILLPGGQRSGIVRFIDRWVSRIFGAAIGLMIKPHYCIGETHGSYDIVSGVKYVCKNAKIIFDLHGAAPEEIEYTVDVRRHHVGYAKYACSLEKEIIRNSDIILSQSDAMFSHLEDKYNKSISNKIVYQCGVDTEKFRHIPDCRIYYRKKLCIDESDVVFVYLGGLHPWQLIDSVFEIFNEYFKQNHCSKLLVLTSEPEEIVMQIAVQHGIRHHMLRVARSPHCEVPCYLSACDLGFLLREDTTLNRVASPTKLGEYLACGLPVITTSVAQSWEWTVGEKNTICVVDHANPFTATSAISSFLQKRGGKIDDSTKMACRSLAMSRLSADQDFINLKKSVVTYE